MVNPMIMPSVTPDSIAVITAGVVGAGKTELMILTIGTV